MKTRRHILAAAAVIMGAATASAWTSRTYSVGDMSIDRHGDLLTVSMTVNAKDLKVKYNRSVEIVPVLRSTDGNDSIVMPAVIVAGRNAYYTDLRDGIAPDARLLRAGSDKPCTYSHTMPWADWMEHSRLDLTGATTGCCGAADGPAACMPVAEIDYRPAPQFAPAFHYEAPQAEATKQRRIEGKAYVSFRVNRTEIDPTYMINPAELAKITGSIDIVRRDPDATVKAISLTGYASPEGPYNNNVRLAKGRTEAVKEYVRKQYDFPAGLFHTSYVPEDWAGLRDSVEAGHLPDRNAILDFIDKDNVPIEQRNDRLMRLFPASYKVLLADVYPWLRHTNYAIDYNLRTYTDVEEIRSVFAADPSKLSLNEFYLLANTYTPGSEEFDKVFDTAVLYYPKSDVANLNAANAAMSVGDYKRARMLLSRIAESSPAVTYGIAVLDALEGNYAAATAGFESAKAAGISGAAEAIAEIRRLETVREPVRYFPDEK